MDVAGRLKAIGALSDSIVFTSFDTTGFWADTLSVAGGWAGIRFQNSSSEPDTAMFEFCRIEYAKKFDEYGGDINGGAIKAENYSMLIIRNCVLKSNMVICFETGIDGPAGGAVYCKDVNTVTIEKNEFSWNRSFDNGGAIHIGQDCQTYIGHNIFHHNRAIQYRWSPPWLVVSGQGAAIGTTDDLGFSPTICDNYCFNNESVNGIIYTSNRQGLIYNNVICNNAGAGIMDGHQLSATRMFNNTVINNTTFDGGILIFSRAIIYNNICWGNERYPGQVQDQINVSEAYPGYQLFNNCVEYGNGGANSISDYPEFIDPTEGSGLAFDGSTADWSLKDESPCINQGTADTTGLFIPEYDIAGNPRIYGDAIEMGAFENQNVITEIDASEFPLNNISVFPNPGKSVINIASSQEAVFVLSTISGTIIIEKQFQTGTNTIDVESLVPGFYLYRILSKNKSVIHSGKWIKIPAY